MLHKIYTTCNSSSVLYFDIIIDDDYHELEANMTFLCNTFNRLKSGGYYIIENVITKHIDDFIVRLEKITKTIGMSY